MNVNIDDFMHYFNKYINIPSPGGYTHEIIEIAKDNFNSMNIANYKTKKGGLIATIPGVNVEEEVTITAHVDTLGLMVKSISKSGVIRFHKIGGGTWNSLEGENCNIINRYGDEIRGTILPDYASSHIYGKAANDTIRNEKNMMIRIDEKVTNRQDILDINVNVGDFIYIDTKSELTENGFLKSRYIDNKSAVAMVFTICKYIKENNIIPSKTVNFFLSTYEEIGHGVSGIPDKTTELLAIDVGIVGDSQESDEHSVSIAAKDNKTPYSFLFRNKLVEIAERNDINYNVDVYNKYGSDASQAVKTGGYDVDFACLGPGVSASHHYERTHLEAIENTIKLLFYYIQS